MARKKADTAPTGSPGPAAGERAVKGRLHQQAAAMLRKIILSGELAPGERLREVAISERLGMSRTPVREAFRTLAAEDLIQLLPNRSVVVSEVNLEDTPDVFTVLATLEALAGQYACRRMTGDQIDHLAELQDQLEAQFEAGDRITYSETNRLIHELIVEGSDNAALISAWRMVLPRVQRARTLNNLDRRRWAQAVVEHRKILEALAARDGTLLASLMKLHFDNGIASMQKKGEAAKPEPKEYKYRPRYIRRRGEYMAVRYRLPRS